MKFNQLVVQHSQIIKQAATTALIILQAIKKEMNRLKKAPIKFHKRIYIKTCKTYLMA